MGSANEPRLTDLSTTTTPPTPDKLSRNPRHLSSISIYFSLVPDNHNHHLETAAKKSPLPILMAASGQAAPRASGRTTKTANDNNDLYTRAEAASKQLSLQGNINGGRKVEISTIIDELIKKAKQAPATTTTTTAAVTPSKTQVETAEMATQTSPATSPATSPPTIPLTSPPTSPFTKHRRTSTARYLHE
jgi:hypothetical protein